MATRYAPIGGQAVIEGVMMRSPSMVSTAVRRPDGTIAVRTVPFVSLSTRLRVLGLPILRGALALIESMQLGMGAITFSAEQLAGDGAALRSAGAGWAGAAGRAGAPGRARAPGRAGAAGRTDDGSRPGRTRRAAILERLAIPLTISAAFGLGLLLFFWLPLVLTELTGARSGFIFNLIDGAFRLAIFLAYLVGVSLWGEMRRVFQYHGAEHKSIAALEAGDELTPERVALYPRFHPRCGTSFLLIVMLGSVLVFMLFGRPQSLPDRLERFLLIPLIGGVAFELTRLSGKWADHPLVHLLVLPGLLLQRITTREPTRDQLEVAIRSVREVTREAGGQLIPV